MFLMFEEFVSKAAQMPQTLKDNVEEAIITSFRIQDAFKLDFHV